MTGAAVTLAVFAAIAGGGPAAAVAPSAPVERILFSSDLEGETRAYSLGLDSSRPRPLFPRRTRLVPTVESADGTTLAYRRDGGIYVSRTDGTGLRRVTRMTPYDLALSRDGKRLLFSAGGAIWILGADGRNLRRLTSGHDDSWPALSPDGRAVAFTRSVSEDPDVDDVVVVKRLDGGGERVLGSQFGVDGPLWSADGRWIAYNDIGGNHPGLWAVRPNGDDLQRVAPDADAFAWSRSGERLASVYRTGLTISDLEDGGSTRGNLPVWGYALAWSPSGARLAVLGGDAQVWTVGAAGGRAGRRTGRGRNGLIGWTTLAPRLRPLPPLPASERVLGDRTLLSRSRIFELSAEGARVAFVAGVTPIDCVHVGVWTPARRSIRRLSRLPAPCDRYRDRTHDLALARTRAAWVETGCCGNSVETHLVAPSLDGSGATAVVDAAAGREGGAGTVIRRPIGDGDLLAFTIVHRCDADEFADPAEACSSAPRGGILYTELWAVGAARPIVKEKGELSLLAVDSGRLVVASESEVRILTADGRVLRRFPVTASNAALSGARLALEGFESIAVYDVRTGRRVSRVASSDRLADLEGNLLVTDGGLVTVRRLGDGRKTTFSVATEARAQLELPGLFVADGLRITFTPMRELLRRLR